MTRLHLVDGGRVQFRPRGRPTFWRLGVLRALPEGRWAVEMVGSGVREPLDGRHELRTTDGVPLHALTDTPWWASSKAVA